jgi:hypothetical protein
MWGKPPTAATADTDGFHQFAGTDFSPDGSLGNRQQSGNFRSWNEQWFGNWCR